MTIRFLKLSGVSLIVMLLAGTSLASAQSMLTPEGSSPLKSFNSYEVSYPKYNEAFITNNTNDTIDVYNTTNPTAPTYITSIPTVGYNPSNEYIDGHYLYVAEQGETSCFNGFCQLIGNYLQIFDITNKKATSPLELLSSYHSKAAQPDYVVVHNNTAYLADWAGATVELVDVADKSSPTLESTLSVNSPTAIAIKGNYAYIGSFSDDSLHIFNIANVSSPVTLTSVPLSGASRLVINGDYIYVSDQNKTVNIVNITNPRKASLVGSIALPANSAPYTLYVDGNNTLYVMLSSESTPQLETFDLAQSPTDPTPLQTFDTLGYGSSFDMVGGTLYLTENNYNSTGTGQIEFYSVTP